MPVSTVAASNVRHFFMVISSEKQQVCLISLGRQRMTFTAKTGDELSVFRTISKASNRRKNQISLLCVFTAWRYAGILRRC